MDRITGLRHWILEGHEPKAVDLLTWARWYETADRRVALDEVAGRRVSTVFLGVDYNFGDVGRPILFESMVFVDGEDEICERYATWDEALAGHRAIVDELTR